MCRRAAGISGKVSTCAESPETAEMFSDIRTSPPGTSGSLHIIHVSLPKAPGNLCIVYASLPTTAESQHIVYASLPAMAGRRGGLKRIESRHCEGAARSNPVINGILDCFASLAMTT
jgi:hypothetical protein